MAGVDQPPSDAELSGGAIRESNFGDAMFKRSRDQELITLLTPRWRDFYRRRHPMFSRNPFIETIEDFYGRARSFILNAYPAMHKASRDQLDAIVFTAIRRSGTHSEPEIAAAIAQLDPRHS